MTSGDHQSGGQPLTKLSWQEKTSFVIKSGGMRTKEHDTPLPIS